MDIKKTIRNYTKIYRKALIKAKISDIDVEIAAYEKRLKEMYASDNFKRHSKYPTTNAVHVYAVIAMCLGLKHFNLSDSQIVDTINCGFKTRRNLFRR